VPLLTLFGIVGPGGLFYLTFPHSGFMSAPSPTSTQSLSDILKLNGIREQFGQKNQKHGKQVGENAEASKTCPLLLPSPLLLLSQWCV